MTLADLIDRHKELGGTFFKGRRNGLPLPDSLVASRSGRYVLFLTAQVNHVGLWRFDTESGLVHALGSRAHECTARLALDLLKELH